VSFFCAKFLISQKSINLSNININIKTMETRSHYCQDCEKFTLQKKAFYNPDFPEQGEIWICDECLESVEFVTSLNEMNDEND